MFVSNNERNKVESVMQTLTKIDYLYFKDLKALVDLFIIIKSLFNVEILIKVYNKYQLIQFD